MLYQLYITIHPYYSNAISVNSKCTLTADCTSIYHVKVIFLGEFKDVLEIEDDNFSGVFVEEGIDVRQK
jgi:hypothetical protein